MTTPNGYNYLDHIRQRHGTGRMRNTFRETAEQDRQKACGLLNEDMLPFPCLFLLRPQIDTFDLYGALSLRNQIAIHICAKKLNTDFFLQRTDRQPLEDKAAVYQALKWMFETGVGAKRPDEDPDAFDAVMDAAAALLIRTHEDKTVLPLAAELIFQRNRNGLLIHDLVWSYFQAADPYALKLIADRLLSGNPKDVKLACSLLHLQIPEETDGRAEKQKLLDHYLKWLNENEPFLYLSGEHFQSASNPEPWKVDLEAKYLNKKISPRNRRPLEPVSENERKWLLRFRETKEADQKILSAYSKQIYDQDIQAWNQWMQDASGAHYNTAKACMGEIR